MFRRVRGGIDGQGRGIKDDAEDAALVGYAGQFGRQAVVFRRTRDQVSEPVWVDPVRGERVDNVDESDARRWVRRQVRQALRGREQGIER